MNTAPAWPKQPVLERHSLQPAAAHLPSLLDLPHVVFTHSGRSAIALALELAGIQPGDEVLVPTYHCPTMIAPVTRSGAVPLFYPLDPEGMPQLAAMPSSPRAKAMLVPHLFGIPRPLGPVVQYCRQRGLLLIEDCAHCFFGRAQGVAVGTSGDFAIGSLPKFFPVIEGGVLASGLRPLTERRLPARHRVEDLRAAWDVIDLASRAGRLGPVGLAARAISAARRGKASIIEPTDDIAPPSPVAVQAAAEADPLLPPRSLRHVEGWIVRRSNLQSACQRRRDNFDAFADLLSQSRGARPLHQECGPDAAPYVLPLIVDHADAAYARMRARGLPVFRWDRLWPGTPSSAGDMGVQWARSLIQIACHQSLTSADVKAIARIVADCIDASH